MAAVAAAAEVQGDEVESSSIYVKNLAWASTDEALKAHFDAAVSASGEWVAGWLAGSHWDCSLGLRLQLGA
jgi:hypothetical protein